MRLKERVALVIGGASGLGRASAEACAEDGARVMVADIIDTHGEEVASGIRAKGGAASFVHTDITAEDSVRRAVLATVREFGQLNILVTSAGGGSREQENPWEFALGLYLRGPMYACKYAVEEMERIGGGVILNIASIAGVTAGVSATVDGTGYPCAKHGVVGLTRTIALAYAKKNIRANAVCPGYIRTELTRPMYDNATGGRDLISEELRVPLDRWGEPHEIGRVVAFLASDDAAYITGQPIIVDGGIMAR
jgi:NAD(P)-dependent dehydrogenase (short-subunit alcohol dehydrogenase family)